MLNLLSMQPCKLTSHNLKHFRTASSALLLIAIYCASVNGAPEHEQPPAPVVVAKVIAMQFKEPVTLVGTVKPDQRSLVATEVAGLMQNMLFNEGDFVKKDEVIAELKQNSLQIRLEEAQSALKEAEARLLYATGQTIRFKDLYAKSVVSIEELQESRSEQDARSEEAIQNKSKIARLVYDLDQMQIRAPFSGHIVSKHTEIGEWLVQGATVYELINLDSNYVLVNVPEHIAVVLKQNDKVEIKFDAFPGLIIPGNIMSIIPQASTKSRTLPVKIAFINKNKKIKSGLLARVIFHTGNEAESNLVPKDAIVEMHNNKFVFAVNDGIAMQIQIETGLAHENLIEIIGSITAGMDVIVRGNERVRPGQPVQIIK
ncbi:MAG: efflux RND transporter periplasmic adaptor subunit [Candidatus Anammoxibacter sp.]